MKYLNILVISCILAVIPFAHGEQASESHKKAIEHLFKTLQMDKQYETAMLAGFDASSGLTPERIASLPEEQREKIKTGIVKVKAKMVELMGWEKVKPDMIELYAKHFSEKEVLDITKLMDSPTGQMMLSKQIGLLSESMAVGQKKAQAILPELMKVMQEELK